jgi:hypothetical protein
MIDQALYDQGQRPRAPIPRMPNTAAVGDRSACSPGCGFNAAQGLVYSLASRDISSREHDANRDRSPLLGNPRPTLSLRIPKNDPPSQPA